MNIEQAIKEWKRKNRRMGCVSATKWFCSRVPSFKPHRIVRYTKEKEFYEHVVAFDGSIIIDLVPNTDKPNYYQENK